MPSIGLYQGLVRRCSPANVWRREKIESISWVFVAGSFVSLVSDIWFEADLGRVVLLIIARWHVDILRISSILSRVLKRI